MGLKMGVGWEPSQRVLAAAPIEMQERKMSAGVPEEGGGPSGCFKHTTGLSITHSRALAQPGEAPPGDMLGAALPTKPNRADGDQFSSPSPLQGTWGLCTRQSLGGRLHSSRTSCHFGISSGLRASASPRCVGLGTAWDRCRVNQVKGEADRARRGRSLGGGSR